MATDHIRYDVLARDALRGSGRPAIVHVFGSFSGTSAGTGS